MVSGNGHNDKDGKDAVGGGGSKSPQRQKVIYDASGKPLNLAANEGTPGLVILKVSKDSSMPSQQLLRNISIATSSNVLVMPMEYELMTGQIATKALESIHATIHKILEFRAEAKGS